MQFFVLAFSDKVDAILFLVFFLGIFAAILYFAFRAFFRSQREERQREVQLLSLLADYRTDQTNRATQSEMLAIIRLSPRLATLVYAAALDAVERTNGGDGTKSLAVDAGRLMHGFNRGTGTPTSYDEQALQNDITSRVVS